MSDCEELVGHIAMIGVLSGPSAENVILPKIFLKQIRTSGIAMGNHQSQNAMVEYMENSDIKPIISDTFDLAELANALNTRWTISNLEKFLSR